ncbi:E3 ubiquitin-protein ligase BRE1 [Aspergillus clavatus NRRL 1]|uniref:E3 ubiquitin protein ligase n=1 Tax=Aspergillus clavatus (strain ATCC 1007 / CBS 513.65 / DSM 816 / NCTC 3887 / NRRL 1 / QM 1276 / 107) TaxID=344612 RepID=A1CM89_ASPCL|nr:histone ubiquitinationc protein (Bre1), putative [Aspergillus clavatus NRRL 1]EAW08676.1 histone ubiquitinationc protein (Bre1), putative [Aspergillus clavatus NRRL 1]
MPAAEASPVASSESGIVKMEDRKRPATYDHNDSAPPLKKHATSVNGGSKPHPDADMPWKDDLERFQKDAIWRQMQEYKREKTSLETKLKEMSKATAYHNDHLRVIDSWFNQLIDEIKTLLGGPGDEERGQSSFQSSLSFEDMESFEKHLKSRSDDIRDIISRLQSSVSRAPPEVTDLQNQLAKKLAQEKTTISELEKALAEKQQLEESLEAASLRYMVAEKKLDRARSLTVAKLEKQYILGAQRPGGDSASGHREEQSPVNGASGAERNLELEETHKRLVAVSEKQKEQLQKLETENAGLLSQITELNIKRSKPTDDDYAHTDLFKQLRSQYDDVVKRINHLEAINIQLREEAAKLRSERTAYRNQIDEETRSVIAEKEAQLMRAETDLARIRNARDELLADQQMRKAAQDQEKTATAKVQELADAGQARITALESEVERLRLQIDNAKTTQATADDIPMEELRAKYQNLERQYSMLNTELASMQTACKKYSSLASQKVTDFSALEEKVARLIAEKSKADQKYFAAMKSKEARELEVRTLRIQNSKTSDIVSQLKESEATTRSLLANMEKQASETKDALNLIVGKNHAAQQQITENNIVIDGLKSQINELKSLSVSKDSTLASTSSACRKAETEIESLKVTLAETKRSLDNWKNKSLGNSSSEYEMLRSLALCTVCRRNFKNTAIKTCGHVFCKECVEERLTSRSRKCPNCNKSFGNSDHMHITL